MAGVDEAGRGPLAGPVVASAVLLEEFRFREKIADSKQLSPKKRELAYQEIQEKAVVGVGIVGERLIDRLNILSATARAMEKAIGTLVSRIRQKPKSRLPAGSFHSRRQAPTFRTGYAEGLTVPEDAIYFLVDGKIKLSTPYSYQTIIGGDRVSLSVACASIVAKVVRDRIMADIDHNFPEYGFARHKGYGTAEHLVRLFQFGPSPVHRKSFRPVKNMVSEGA